MFLNRCVSLVRSTMASFGAVLTFRGVPPPYAFVLPTNSSSEWTVVFLDLKQKCTNQVAVVRGQTEMFIDGRRCFAHDPHQSTPVKSIHQGRNIRPRTLGRQSNTTKAGKKTKGGIAPVAISTLSSICIAHGLTCWFPRQHFRPSGGSKCCPSWVSSTAAGRSDTRRKGAP